MIDETLPNGVRLIVEPGHPVPVASVQLWVGAGSADERPDQAGLAHLHEHMLFKGTARRGVGEIAEEIEAAGGDVNAWTSFDETVYHATIESSRAEVAVDVLLDAVQNSAFDPQELGREIEVVLEEIRRGKDSPGRVLSQLVFSSAFPDHPYGRPVIGSEESVRSFDRDAVLEFYRAWYRPENLTMVVAGDVEPDRVRHWVESRLPNRSGAAPERVARGRTQPFGEVRVGLARMDVQESQIQVAWPAPDVRDPHVAALDLLAVVLGTGDSSRLHRRLVRDERIASEAYAYCHTPTGPGLFGVGADVQGENVLDVARSAVETALRTRDVPVTATELRKAKNILLSEQVYARETTDGLARKLGFLACTVGDLDFEQTYYAALEAATPDDLVEAARRFLDPAGLSVSLLLPRDQHTSVDEDAVRASVSDIRPPRRRALAKSPEGFVQVRLDNGVRVVLEEDRAVPRVSLRASAVGGLLAEPPTRRGLSHLVCQLLVRGTRRYSAEVMSEALDGMAAGIAGLSGRNSVGLAGDFLSEHWAPGLDLFSSCLTEPIFEPEELGRERQIQLEDISRRGDAPSTVAMDRLHQALFGDHPYASPSLGDGTSVAGLGRDQALEAWARQLRPDRTVVSVVGAVDPGRAIDDIACALERWRPGGPEPDIAAPPAPLSASRRVYIPMEREQVHLALGFLGTEFADPRRADLEVLATVLGGQGGRLFLDLRDRQSLAYAVSAASFDGLHPGSFFLHIATHPDKAQTAWDGLRAHVEAVIRDPITEKERDRAVRHLVGGHAISLQRAGARSTSMALMEAYGLGHDEHVRHPRLLEAVTPESVLSTARALLSFDRCVQVVAGPSDLEGL